MEFKKHTNIIVDYVKGICHHLFFSNVSSNYGVVNIFFVVKSRPVHHPQPLDGVLNIGRNKGELWLLGCNSCMEMVQRACVFVLGVCAFEVRVQKGLGKG